jgi:hypothetical protein
MQLRKMFMTMFPSKALPLTLAQASHLLHSGSKTRDGLINTDVLLPLAVPVKPARPIDAFLANRGYGYQGPYGKEGLTGNVYRDINGLLSPVNSNSRIFKEPKFSKQHEHGKGLA